MSHQDTRRRGSRPASSTRRSCWAARSGSPSSRASPHFGRRRWPVAGSSELEALAGGYHAAFLVGAVFAATAAVIGVALLRPRESPAPHAIGNTVPEAA